MTYLICKGYGWKSYLNENVNIEYNDIFMLSFNNICDTGIALLQYNVRSN